MVFSDSSASNIDESPSNNVVVPFATGTSDIPGHADDLTNCSSSSGKGDGQFDIGERKDCLKRVDYNRVHVISSMDISSSLTLQKK
eukprot:4151859-Ditylum_brightwellii.AAC.1